MNNETVDWDYFGQPLNFLEELCVKTLKCGPIPKSVAFIPDGHRRLSKNTNCPKDRLYNSGSRKILQVFKWCKEFGVKEVTFFCFSIANYNRTKEEVEMLKKIGLHFIDVLLNNKEKMIAMEYEVGGIGNRSYLEDYLRVRLEKLDEVPWRQSGIRANLAIAYTSTDEITRAVRKTVKDVEEGRIEEVDVENLQANIETRLPKIDLLIRSSDESRFSDFMLWQAEDSINCFYNLAWPKINFWHVAAAIFRYQVAARRSC